MSITIEDRKELIFHAAVIFAVGVRSNERTYQDLQTAVQGYLRHGRRLGLQLRKEFKEAQRRKKTCTGDSCSSCPDTAICPRESRDLLIEKRYNKRSKTHG
jgi:hypothetical protein